MFRGPEGANERCATVTWLGEIVRGFIKAILECFITEAKKPSTAEDAVTPKDEKKKWNAYVKDQTKGKDDYIPGVDKPR